MKVSAVGRLAIEAREGRRLVAYRDSVGVLTIGVGHTGRMSPPVVTDGMRITVEQCDAFLAADLAPVEAAISGLSVPLTQNQFDALASFAFNIGAPRFETSTVASMLKHGMFTNAADAMLQWEKPAVLKTRREAERKQFLTPDAAPVAGRPIPSSAAPVVAEALNPKKESTPMTTNTKPAAAAGAKADTGHVNILAGIENIFGTVVSGIESAITVAKSPSVPQVQSAQPGAPVTFDPSGGTVGAVFNTISDAENAVAEVKQVLADAQAGNWGSEPNDVINLLKTVFSILSRFGINVPVVSAIVSALPTLPAVAAAA